MKRTREVPLVQQMEIAECGVACLSMIFQYHGHFAPLPEFREACGTSRDGNSALDLVKAARSLGINARGLSIDLEGLRTIRKPAILHWDFNHFLVLEAVEKDALVIVDPANGRRRVSLSDASSSFSGVALELTPGPKFRKGKKGSVSVGRYVRAMADQWRAVAFVLLASMTQQMLAIGMPVASQLLIDQVVLPKRASWFIPVLATLSFASVAQLFLQRLQGMTQVILHSAVGTRLCADIGERFLRLPLPFLESRSHGDLLDRASMQHELQQLLSQTVHALLDAVFVCLLIALMLLYDPLLGSVSLALTASRIMVVRWVRKPIKQRSAAVMAARGRELGTLAEATTALEMIRAFGAERNVITRYVGRVTERAQWSIGSERLERGLERVMGVVGAAMHGLILWIGGSKVVSGEMTIGVFSGFLVIRSMVGSPMSSLVGLMEGWIRVRGLLERCDDVMNVAPLAESGADAVAIHGRIEVQNLGFRFGSGGRWILKNVNFLIRPGEHVAIIGPSGQGKSTLGKLICGLLEPSEGRVLIDGRDVREYDRRKLAARLGVVLQQPLILEASLEEALRLRCPDCSIEDIQTGARLACLEEIIDKLPQGYGSLLAATGSNLSGGERQRVALAQALIGSPRILILDEATCSLDKDLERRVMRNIGALHVTTVSIAHRDTVIAHADRVFDVCAGAVREKMLTGSSARSATVERHAP